jgi:exodeoxyribonuclease VII small subunit
MNEQPVSYDEAIRRIEEIVSILEKGEKGIDELSSLVLEASALIKLSREKLRGTEEAIAQAFQNPIN